MPMTKPNKPSVPFKEASVKATKPLSKAATPKTVESLAKTASPLVPVKEAIAKPLVKEAATKISATDTNDSKTRYYKYPVPPKPPQ